MLAIERGFNTGTVEIKIRNKQVVTQDRQQLFRICCTTLKEKSD
jgi:hypothetical protein